MQVLRLCSVYETPVIAGRAVGFDPVGGMQHHAAQLTRALQAAGVRQRVLTAYRPGAPAFEQAGDGATVRRVGLPLPVLRQCWVPAAAVSLRAAVPGTDVVHAHLGEDVALLPLAVLAARRAAAPLVVTVHCSTAHTVASATARGRALATFGAAAERRVLPRADAVITLTARLAELLACDGVDPRRITVIPSGADHRRFDPHAPDPFPDRPRPRVLFVGRLCDQKGVDVLVDAVAEMRSGADVIVVGDGPHRASLERRTARRRVDDRMVFTGFWPHQRVAAAMLHADVLVVPSRYEELGSVLAEALHAGLPVVASAVGGIPEIVHDGLTGRLVPPGDPGALAGAVDDLVASPELRRRYRAASLAAAAPYRWEHLAERVAGVYRAVLERRLPGNVTP